MDTAENNDMAQKFGEEYDQTWGSFDEMTPELLTERLSRNGFLRKGHIERIDQAEAFESNAGFWFRLKLKFSPDYEGDVPIDVMLKLYRARRIHGGVAEWAFYSELAPQTPGASVCPVYDCAIDHDRRRCHFLMRDIGVTHENEPPKERPYGRAVEEVLKYHISWWNHTRLDKWPFTVALHSAKGVSAAIAEEEIRKSCVDYEGHLRTFVEEKGDKLEAGWIRKMEQVIPRYADVFSSRVSDKKNTTLLHGDLHLWNFAYPKDPMRDQLILLDWENNRRGLGPYDLAYMLVHATGGRSRAREIEANLINLYYAKLTDQVADYSREAFEYDFRLSIISTTFFPLYNKLPFAMRSAMDAYGDWDCDELLT